MRRYSHAIPRCVEQNNVFLSLTDRKHVVLLMPCLRRPYILYVIAHSLHRAVAVRSSIVQGPDIVPGASPQGPDMGSLRLYLRSKCNRSSPLGGLLIARRNESSGLQSFMHRKHGYGP